MNENQVVVQLGDVKNECFVVMPFDSIFDLEYKRVIEEALDEVGLKPVRGDQVYAPKTIIENIWNSIREARLVIAELSGRNPNVLYEIGLAHAIGKPIILLTREEADVPIDLKSRRYIYYDLNDPFWGETLRSKLVKTLRDTLDRADVSGHLPGVNPQVNLPDAPRLSPRKSRPRAAIENFSGVWNTTWTSIPSGRVHDATLTIPEKHGPQFGANMTVKFVRDGEETIVDESMSGTVDGANLTLRGGSYTYLKRGKSTSYRLDSFHLMLSDEGTTLVGMVNMRHGSAQVVFFRALTGSSDPDDQDS